MRDHDQPQGTLAGAALPVDVGENLRRFPGAAFILAHLFGSELLEAVEASRTGRGAKAQPGILAGAHQQNGPFGNLAPAGAITEAAIAGQDQDLRLAAGQIQFLRQLPAHIDEAARQVYFDRWQIEVNHREEKNTLGAGQAQLWNVNSAPKQPVLAVAVYSALLLASLKAFGAERGQAYAALPKWRRNARRPSCLDLITLLRKEMAEQPQQLAALGLQATPSTMVQAAAAWENVETPGVATSVIVCAGAQGPG